MTCQCLFLAEVKFTDRKSALQQKVKNGLMPFVTQYNPSVPNLKNILMSKWHLIENQPMLREIYREPPLISYRRGKSLKDILVRAKLLRSKTYYITKQRESCLACQPLLTAYLRAALMRVNMVIGNVPSLRARISSAALINFLSQLLRLF